MRRTIYTTLIAFEPEIKRGLRVLCLPEVQEVSELPCDTGSDIDSLKKEMKNKPVDLPLVPKDWNTHQGRWSSEAAMLDKRATEAREWLYSRPEKEIVLVTHGGYLHYITEDWVGITCFAGPSLLSSPLTMNP